MITIAEASLLVSQKSFDHCVDKILESTGFPLVTGTAPPPPPAEAGGAARKPAESRPPGARNPVPPPPPRLHRVVYLAKYCGRLSQAALAPEEGEIENRLSRPPIKAAQAAPAPYSPGGSPKTQSYADSCIPGPRGPVSGPSEIFATLPAAVGIVQATVIVWYGIAFAKT